VATLTVPSNVNGTVFDPILTSVVSSALSSSPFGFEDVIVYSHGWSTDADHALVDYDRFSIGLERCVLVSKDELAAPPRAGLQIGIHWPSEITEDPNSALNDLQLLTFYQMEHRADAVGRNLVYSLIRLALDARRGQAPLRFLLIGHSFGCKVVCAALQDVQTDIANKTIPISAQTEWRVVLLEPATDCDNLEPGDIYGNVHQIANFRMLITKSSEDTCLTRWYPDASRLANLFHGAHPTDALGAAGPTQKTRDAFATVTDLTVPLGFQLSQATAAASALVVADLTPAHAARASSQPPLYQGGICGSHSDLFFDEIFNLVAGFSF
jgi:hypothetical protein